MSYAPTEKQQKTDALAREVLRLSRNTLLVNLRFLDMALSQFDFIPAPGTLATDGRHIYYNALHVLLTYKAEKECSVRDYLHMVLHCVFRHSFVNTLPDRDCWDLACDIAVENIINDLGLSSAAASRQTAQMAVLSGLKQELKQLTAEKLYHHYLEQHLPPDRLRELRRLFLADDHTIWYLPSKQNALLSAGSSGQSGSSGQGGSSSQGGSSGQSSSSGPERQGGRESLSQSQLNELWKDIAQRIQVDLETFSQQQGSTAGNLMQNLRAVTREKHDYTAFLRKFAVMGEVMKVNDDEFDYIFYTYGMKLFDNMPLIEPLEYKETKRIREFVIAIDTSGSVSGELVQRFIQKTYNILKQEESFFTKINLHIIQCDAAVQEDAKITSQEEFDRYLSSMQLRGFGGTDFRPVFAYVEKLRREREFSNLKGLIYFTDGFGVFPEQKPDYHTAFVFINDAYQMPEVPPWAIRLVLEPEEI